jgi:hypothetical protein
MAKMYLISNEAGRIVGAGHLAPPAGAGPHVGIRPLLGQRLHEVDVPHEIAGLTTGHHLHLALSHARFDPITGKIVFKKLRTKQLHP